MTDTRPTIEDLINHGQPEPNRDTQKAIEITRKDLEVKEDEKPLYNTTQLYHQGLARYRDNGFLLVPEIDSKTFCHTVYRSSEPDDIPGINFPQGFRYWKRAIAADTISELTNLAQGWDGPLGKMFVKSYQPKQRQSELLPLESLAIDSIASENARVETGDYTFNLGLNPGCEGMPLARNNPNDYLDSTCEPTAFLPPKNWFSPQVQTLKLGDIITILPPDELSMFSLAFGRGLVGRAYHIPPGSNTPVVHRARMALLVKGDAGVGKSYTLEYGLLRVAKRLGYKVSESFNLEGKFNDAAVFQSHFSYLDDTNIKQLSRLAASDVTKRTITNSTIKYEQKYLPGATIPCHTFLIVCLNEIDEYVVFSMDEGNADRLKLVTCYNKAQLDSEPLVVNGTKYPTRNPALHVPKLANDLGVSEDTLWLWACRLMADDFYSHLDDLQDEVATRSNKLVFSWMKSLVPGIMGLAYTLYLAGQYERRGSNGYERWSEVGLHQISATSFLQNLNTLFVDDYRTVLRGHYQADPYDDHPYQWLTRLNRFSLENAQTMTKNRNEKQNTAIPWETCLQYLELQSGFSFKPGHHRIVQGWTKAVANKHLYSPIAEQLAIKAEEKGRQSSGAEYSEVFKPMLES